MSSDDPTQPMPPSDEEGRSKKPLRPDLPPVLKKVNLDARGMPLPNRVPERDPHATRVQPRLTIDESQPHHAPSAARLASRGSKRKPLTLKAAGRLMLFVFLGLLALVAVVVALAGTYGIWEYAKIAATLPNPDDLASRAAQFESTFLYDSNGALLYEINDPDKGKRTRIPLDKISPYVVAATIATEDRNYYSHPGFDPVAILKAVYRAYQSGDEPTGASTITQQLTRAFYFRLAACDQPDAPIACYEYSVERKIREIILASEINRRYTKEQILELYLNEIYYGNLAYGIEAAAETYFGKDAASLTLSEAAFLAGLPQAPATYDVFTNRDAALNRQKTVLLLMIEASGECNVAGNGIVVSNANTPICITQSEAAKAILDIQSRQFTPPVSDARYPHWVDYIRLLLENEYGTELYRAGFRVYTTLNPALQDLAEAEVKAQVDALAGQHVTDGALVAIDPRTGFILAMVGSNDYADPDDGQINMAIRPRQPGSSIKTLTYVAAFQNGWTPATLIWDVPSKFPDGANPPYEPVNYDRRFHGPVRLRDALANSYNIPAVKALEFVGIYDNLATPTREGLIAFAETLGIATLTRNDYGLAMSLGGADVTLLEMTGAYATLANSGKRVFPVSITRITNSGGVTLCQQPLPGTPAQPGQTFPPCQLPPANWDQQVVRPEHAFLISDILADNHARSLAFGPNSTLRLEFPAAVKTGTTNDYRDNWTIGYTPNLAIGVWVGNADYTPMGDGIISGVTGAGPIWHNVMTNAFGTLGIQPQSFVQPPGVISLPICAVTGAAQNPNCDSMVDPRRPNEPPVRMEYFAASQPPLPADRDVVAVAYIDKFSGLRVSEACPDNWEEKEVVNISDTFALDYLANDATGRMWAGLLSIEFPITLAPVESCNANSPRPIAAIISPSDFQTLDGVVQVFGIAHIANGDFDHFIVDWGISHNPGGWASVVGPNPISFADVNLLANWDTANVPNGEATLRLTVFDKQGNSVESRVRIYIQHPATPVPPTNTPAPTATSVPPTATPEPSATPPPTETVAPSATPAPSHTPSVGASATP